MNTSFHSFSINVSIIIPVHELNDQLKLNLNAVKEYIPSHGYELLVVLDGINNDPVFFEEFNSLLPQIIELQLNKGPATARNLGAKKATGKYLLFLDSDVIINATTFIKLQSLFSKSPIPKAIIGSYDDAPLDQSMISRFRNLLHHYTHQHASEKATTFWGACGVIRRDLFLEVGGFDISFETSSVEDIELGYRLADRGVNICLEKNLQVKHAKKWTLISMIKTDVFNRAKPWTQLLLLNKKRNNSYLNIKHKERISAMLLVLLVFCSFFGVFVSNMFFGSLFAGVLLLALNFSFYQFLGNYFQSYQYPITILLHWIYYLSASTGLVLAIFDYLFAKGILNLKNTDCKLNE